MVLSEKEKSPPVNTAAALLQLVITGGAGSILKGGHGGVILILAEIKSCAKFGEAERTCAYYVMSTTAMIRPEGRVTVPSPTGARRGDMFTPRMIHRVTWTRFIYYYLLGGVRVVFDAAFIYGSVHIVSPPSPGSCMHALQWV